MEFFKINNKSVAYNISGSGAPVILVHCSSASHRMWQSLTRELDSKFCVFAPDLLGYGASDGWTNGEPFDPFADIALIMHLIDLADGPVHLVGHSYGGAIALEAARLKSERIKSLTLIEPVAFHLLAMAGKTDEANQVKEIADRVIVATEQGELEKATRIYMSFWLGRVRWALTPKKIKNSIGATVNKVALEFGGMKTANVALDEYQKISAQTLLIAGSRTRKPARTLIDILSETLPNTEISVIAKAGHMSPITHTKQVNALIQEHFDSLKLDR